MCKYTPLILSLNVLSIETDLDVKLELKTVMKKSEHYPWERIKRSQ